jgi:hypothetical protein
LIYTVIARDDIDRKLAAKVSIWLWKHGGVRDAEFWVFGDHTLDYR